MPPDGFTTVTISDDTATKLAEIVANQELESVADAIDYAATIARDQETLSDAELAYLLYQRLAESG